MELSKTIREQIINKFFNSEEYGFLASEKEMEAFIQRCQTFVEGQIPQIIDQCTDMEETSDFLKNKEAYFLETKYFSNSCDAPAIVSRVKDEILGNQKIAAIRQGNFLVLCLKNLFENRRPDPFLFDGVTFGTNEDNLLYMKNTSKSQKDYTLVINVDKVRFRIESEISKFFKREYHQKLAIACDACILLIVPMAVFCLVICLIVSAFHHNS